MNEANLLREMNADLQRAPARRVIYLEGKTDIPIFFGLLGVAEPRDGTHNGVLVRGLKDSGSGGGAVRMRVSLAARSGYAGIYGITDGDGEGLSALQAAFLAPYAGPAFRWPAYCIENMLVKVGWPAAWGAAPDWRAILLDHVPYVALNRLHREIFQSLVTLRLERFSYPTLEEPLKSTEEVLAALARDKHLVASYDVEARFAHEAALVSAAIDADTEQGHVVVNGKWLVDVFAPRLLGKKWDKHRCRDAWVAHATTAGGHPDVAELWQRITGRAP